MFQNSLSQYLKKVASMIIADLRCPIFNRDHIFLQKALAFASMYLIVESDSHMFLKMPCAFLVYLFSVNGFVNTEIISIYVAAAEKEE